MKAIYCGVILFLVWTAFYTLITVMKDERFILAGFVAASIVSMLTAAFAMARGKHD